MPTYLCYAAANQLASEQKAAVAEAITSGHSEEAAAPRYLVQVIFHDLKPSDNYIEASLRRFSTGSAHFGVRSIERSAAGFLPNNFVSE